MTPPLELTPPRRVHVAWQSWFGGQLARNPLALADGAVVVIDHTRHSSVRRIDEAGLILWETDLEGRASGDPARTLGWLVVPCDGVRVLALNLETGQRAGPSLGVPGLVVHGPIAALRGHVVARFASAGGNAAPFLLLSDLSRAEGPTLLPDPLGAAIESRFRATNQTFVLAGEDTAGFAIVAAIDAESRALLWSHRLEACGLSHLWAAGGLVDVVYTDRVRSYDARSGVPLTTRFEGMVLDDARLAGETLLVTLGGTDASSGRQLLAFDAMTEEPFGEHRGFQRVVGACSDECLVADLEDHPVLLELPSLLETPIRDGQGISSPRMVAWSRHRAYVVGHDGHSLSAVDLT